MDASILLLGVPCLRCTFFHVLEQLVQVRYRRWRDIDARWRDEPPLPTSVYSWRPGFAGNDFNKLCCLLEEQGLVRVGTVGNAVARLFRARDAFEVGLAECRRDPQLFLRTGERCVGLDYGVLTDDPDNEKSVFDVTAIYGGSS